MKAVAEIASVEKNVSEERDDDDVVGENRRRGSGGVSKAVEEIVEEVADAQADERVVEVVRVRQGIVEHLRCSDNSDDQ